MQWTEAGKFQHREYEFVLAAVPNYEGTMLIHKIAMWDPENDQWTVFGTAWHPQPTHVMPLPDLPDMTRAAIAAAANLSIHSAAKDRKLIRDQK